MQVLRILRDKVHWVKRVFLVSKLLNIKGREHSNYATEIMGAHLFPFGEIAKVPPYQKERILFLFARLSVKILFFV